MENCWFVLKQSHYPPPTFPASGIGSGNGAICLGHIIPNAKDLDGVLNRSVEGFTFTPAVPIYPTKALDLEWEMRKGHKVGLSADAGVPIGQAVGVTAEANAALAFQKTVDKYRFFDKLERYIILPTRGYIAQILENAEVNDHIEKHKFLGAWAVFMITGITVARGSRGGSSESKRKAASAGARLTAEGVAGGGLDASATSEQGMSMSAGLESDFVWAVRLTKIWKGTTDRTWSFRTQSKGSTFSVEDEGQRQVEAAQALEAEGEGEAERLWLQDEDGFLVF